MKTVTIKMPETLYRRLHREASAVRETTSSYVRQAVLQRLEQQPAPGTSLLDRLKGIIGSVEGPPDLSTNPKYMEGYGETCDQRHRRRRRAAQSAR